jgi:fused signal recognition particle receptor
VRNKTITSGTDLQKALAHELETLLTKTTYAHDSADIILLVGINGSGKTSAAGKLANQYRLQGKPVILTAADTFRAAAVEQLRVWAERTQSTFISGKDGQDPASVVFAGLDAYAQKPESTLIIDTAGRLQTKVNLMRELEKIRTIITKKAPQARVKTLLTVDAMLGQNSFDQAKLFHESTHLDGIILTKMDGTGKGGIIFSITETFSIPVAFITFGETITDIQPFDPHAFISDLLTAE